MDSLLASGINCLFRNWYCVQVASFYLRLDNESQDLKGVPSDCVVKLDNSAVEVRALDAAPVIQVIPSSGRKVPASIEETKVKLLQRRSCPGPDVTVILMCLYLLWACQL